MKKINFKRFKTPEELEAFLQSLLPLGSSTSGDVICFLKNHSLRYGDLLDNSEIFREKPVLLTNRGFFHPKGSKHMVGWARAKPTLFFIRQYLEPLVWFR